MSPLRLIFGFFLRAGAYYALLMSPWHGLMDAYRVAFRTMGNAAFARLAGGAAGAQFSPLSDDAHGNDTAVRLLKRENRLTGSMEFKSGFQGYRPTAFFVALVVATPVPWWRRGGALLFGGIGVTSFVLFRVWLQLANGLSDGNVLDVYQLSVFGKTVLTACLKIFAATPAIGYIVPGLIWVLSTFRRGDWDRLQGHFQDNSGTQTEPPLEKKGGRRRRGDGDRYAS